MRVIRNVHAPGSSVWAVLSDGWLYATWVVGASRVRAVDASWPSPGSKIHHSFGMWPAVINDESVCLEAEAPRRMVLQARGWPMGEARVEMEVTETSGGCTVSILEDVVKGPATLVPVVVRQPILAVRNKEALYRLALLAEGQARGQSSAR